MGHWMDRPKFDAARMCCVQWVKKTVKGQGWTFRSGCGFYWLLDTLGI
jgi:hypothetical protein